MVWSCKGKGAEAYCQEFGPNRGCNCFLGDFNFDLLVHAKGEVPFDDNVGHFFEDGGGHVFGTFGGVPNVTHAAGHDGDDGTWSSVSKVYLSWNEGYQLAFPAIASNIFHQLHIYGWR